MPSPSLTYTLTNGTTADADQVMQNFNDLLNGITDGTKDLSVSALTAAGTTTLNGAVTLGNASSDDITVTGSLASSIPIKTTNSYNIGSSTLGLASIYFGANSQTVRLLGSGSMSATWSMTLPVSAGTAGFGLQTNGSGVTSWQPMQTDTYAASADYTVLDTDGYANIEVTTGGTNRTVTLPTAADNTDRRLRISKVDSGTGTLTIDGENAETIDGAATITLLSQYAYLEIYCNGTSWKIVSLLDKGDFTPALTKQSGAGTLGATTVVAARYARSGHTVHIDMVINPFTVTGGTIVVEFTLPIGAKTANRITMFAVDVGTVAVGRLDLAAGSATVTAYASVTAGLWGISAANSSIRANFSYEVS